MIKTHLLASSMAGIGIYYFLFLSFTFSKMCYDTLNSYTKENRETALFYSFQNQYKKNYTEPPEMQKKKINQCNIRMQIQCYFSQWVLGSSHSSGGPCLPQPSLTLLCLTHLGPAELTALGQQPWEGAGGKEESRKERTPSAPCCKAPVS